MSEQNGSVLDSVPTAAESASEAVAQQTEGERAECAKLLTKAVSAFRRGTRGYSAAYFESAALVAEYLGRRLAIDDARSAIMQTVEGQLSAHSADPIDGNAMVRANAAFRLLAGEIKAADCKVGLFHKGFNLLVERETKDKAETWRILPGMEETCREYFGHAIKEGFGAKAVNLRCAELEREHNQTVAKAREEAEAAAQAARDAAAQEKKAAQDALDAAKRATDAANQAAAVAVPEAKAEAEAAAQKAAQEQKEAEQRAKQAVQASKDKEREANKAAREKAEADRRLLSSEDKLERRATAGEAPGPRQLLQTTQRAAAAGTVKDVVDMAVGVVTKSQEPDSVFYGLLAALANHVDMSKQAQRVAKGALLLRDAEERRSEEAKAHANGK